MDKKFKYNDAINEIERIVDEMENEEIDIDKLPDQVKRAFDLINSCKEKLHTIEAELNKNQNI